MIWLARALRTVAVAIAILGVIDPVWSRPLADRPPVAVVDAGDATLGDTVARALSRTFDVRRGATAGAVATVLVGRSLPPEPPPPSGAIVAVVPPPAPVRVLQISVPASTPAGSRAPIDVSLHATALGGRSLRVDALADGVLLDRQVVAVKSGDEPVRVSLSAPALAAGMLPITVRVVDDTRPQGAALAEWVVATEVRATAWRVLVADARPSWTSTFVRRALEADRRFVVASRVSVSRGLSAEAGGAPATLADVASLEGFDAVVVGAPDALTAAEVQALERFARERGGALVLLSDRIEAGPAVRLIGAASLTDLHGIDRRRVTSTAGVMIATELAVPVGLTSSADVLAQVDGRPAVWSVPLGAGRVIVNGALDAWRYRAREDAGFAAFWAHAVATAAAAAPPPLTVSAARATRPGAPVDVRVTVRSLALADVNRATPPVDVHAMVSLTEGAERNEPMRLWPSPERGVFIGAFQPEDGRRTYRVAVDANSADGAAIGVASADVLTGEPRVLPTDDVEPWTSAHGGTVVASADPVAALNAVASVVSAAQPPAMVHPMRSLWWWPVFVLALGGEWWLRRRGGLR